MVLKLHITLHNSVHLNCRLLTFLDRPPNELPASDIFCCGEIVKCSFPFCCGEMVKFSFPFCCVEMVKCSFPICCGEIVKYSFPFFCGETVNCTLVTTNLPFARVLLAYPPHAAWIAYVSSSLRCPIPSGSVNMSSWMPFLVPRVLMPNVIRILSVVH